MAITKTTTISQITVTYNGDDANVQVYESISWDDPNDDNLPIYNNVQRMIERVNRTTTYDPNSGDPTVTETPNDLSGEDAKIVTICNAVWPSE